MQFHARFNAFWYLTGKVSKTVHFLCFFYFTVTVRPTVTVNGLVKHKLLMSISVHPRI